MIEQIDEALTATMVWGHHTPVTCADRTQAVRVISHLMRTSPCPVMVVSWDDEMDWAQHVVAHWSGVGIDDITTENLDIAQWQRVLAARRALDARDLSVATQPERPDHVVSQWRSDHLGETVVVMIEAPQALIDPWFADSLDGQRIITVRIDP